MNLSWWLATAAVVALILAALLTLLRRFRRASAARLVALLGGVLLSALCARPVARAGHLHAGDFALAFVAGAMVATAVAFVARRRWRRQASQ
jgi:hypothetical protein